MTVELGVVISLIGIAISFAAFYAGRISASKKEGVAAGSQTTAFSKDIDYIKESLTRIENSLTGDISKLSGRVDVLSTQVVAVATTAEKARSSAKSAHLRLNTHERMEHGKTVSDWREGSDDE